MRIMMAILFASFFVGSATVVSLALFLQIIYWIIGIISKKISKHKNPWKGM